jgi:hypothetical protein
MSSKKSLQKARESIREKTGPSKCFKVSPMVVKDLIPSSEAGEPISNMAILEKHFVT